MKRPYSVSMAVSVTVLVFGLSAYIMASRKARAAQKEEPLRRVCVISLESHIDSQGNETFIAMRWNTHDPAYPQDYRIERKLIGQDGPPVVLSREGDGAFAQRPGQDKMRLKDEEVAPADMAAKHERQMHTDSWFLSSPEFAGTETIAGFEAYNIKSPVQDGAWIELSYSPNVGPTPLRTISHQPDGSEDRILAVKVEFK